MGGTCVYTITNILFTSFGVFLIWASWGAGQLSVKYLNKRLAEVGLSSNQLLVVEFLVTMVLGVTIAITFVRPETVQQAIAAGMGWTSLVTKPTSNDKSENDHEH